MQEEGSYAEQNCSVDDGIFMHRILASFCEGWNPFEEEKQDSFN